MITHVIVKLDAPIEEKYWQDDDVFSNEYYGLGKPLIRCKDCKYKNEYGYCTVYLNFHHLTADMDYCSDAERKEE